MTHAWDKTQPTTLIAGDFSQNPDTDFEQEINSTSPVHPFEEQGDVPDQEIGIPEQESDLVISDEQNYQETVRLVRHFVGWHQVHEFESSAASQDNHNQLVKLNLTLTEGYSTHNTDTNGLSKDQFLKASHTQKWFDVYLEIMNLQNSIVLSLELLEFSLQNHQLPGP